MNQKALKLDHRFKKKIEEIFRHASKSQKQYISILYEAATHDEKTELYNSNFFDNILEMEMEKAQRGRGKLSLLIIDIDFFKKINDIYGHLKADEFLVRLAKILQEQIRKSDVAARFGGEEFFILLPQTPIEKAKTITSRLRNAIKKDKILGKYGITVSGGLTCYKGADTRKSFMERADKAMYKAKNSGRDRFVAVE